MKVYGYRNRSNYKFTVLTDNLEGSKEVVGAWLAACKIPVSTLEKHFEEIEADIEYTTGDST